MNRTDKTFTNPSDKITEDYNIAEDVFFVVAGEDVRHQPWGVRESDGT